MIHIVANIALGFLPIVIASTLIQSPSWREALFLLAALIVGNFAVFAIHKHILHSQRFSEYAYRVHTLWHHRFFTDAQPSWDGLKDFFIICFPTRVVAGFALILLPAVFFAVQASVSRNAACFAVIGSAAYFILYEFTHFASHVKEGHWLTKIPPLGFMRRYHLYHHDPLHMERNFNVVYPLADYVFGDYTDARNETAKRGRSASRTTIS